jgi:hypothetical protein
MLNTSFSNKKQLKIKIIFIRGVNSSILCIEISTTVIDNIMYYYVYVFGGRTKEEGQREGGVFLFS